MRLAPLAFVLAISGYASAASVDLAGTDADGYLAIAGFNQESGVLTDISRDTADAKFFDYPAYANPDGSERYFVMSVEPYRFGLDYPDPLHPAGGGFQSVGALQPVGTPGATFIEAVTEDADFESTDIGQIDFDSALLTGVGAEFIGPGDLTLLLDGAEFTSKNRDPSFQGGANQAADGRSNNNEFANDVTFVPGIASGTGLTYVDGVLQSIDLVVPVEVSTGQIAFGGAGFAANGTLTFSGNTFAFDVDEVTSGFFASRVILNRSGVISAVVPEPTSVALLMVGGLACHFRQRD